jgi:O-antigen/teichoic acid export membrane protein
MRSSLRELAAALPVIAYRAMAGGMPILLGLFIAHRWGLGELASFTVANAAIAVALVAVDWGATRALPRNLAMMPPDGAAGFLAAANGFRLLVVALLLVCGGLAVVVGGIDRGVAVYLALLFPLCPISLLTTNAIGERVVAGETKGIGIAAMSGFALFASASATAVSLGFGPRWLVAAYVFGKAIESVVVTAGRWWVLSVRTSGVAPAAAALWPFAAQMLLGVVYSRLSVFTVERMTTRADLGLFSFALALQSALLLVPVSLGLVHFPDLTRRTRAGDAAGVRAVVIRYSVVSVACIVAALAAIALLMPLARQAFRLPRHGGAFVLALAALAVLSVFSTMAGFLVQAAGREHLAARLSLITLVMAALYQLAALRWLGLWGIIPAMIAAEVTTIVLFGQALRAVRRNDR